MYVIAYFKCCTFVYCNALPQSFKVWQYYWPTPKRVCFRN